MSVVAPQRIPSVDAPALTRIPRLYAAFLRAELQAAAAYRWQIVLGVLEWVVPLAFLALWRGAASSGPVDGITATQFSTYFCLLLISTSLQIAMPVIFDFGRLVYSGQLSPLLLRPHHPIHQVVARGLADRVYAVPVILLLAPVALALTGGRVTADVTGWCVALGVMVLGSVGFGYLAAMAGAIAFWMTKAQGIQGLLVGAEWVVGGIIAPVGLLPGVLPDLVRHQPLWYADGAAPEILAGISAPSGWMLLEAAAWVVVLHLLYRRLWARAVRRYEAVGT